MQHIDAACPKITMTKADRPLPALGGVLPLASSMSTVPQNEGRFLCELRRLVGRELRTLERLRPFRVQEVTASEVTVHVSTGHFRNIRCADIQGAWDELLRSGELSRVAIQERCSERHSAYVAALLAEFPGVRHETRPIALFYDPRMHKSSN